ncbi:hypothetical protein [Ruegeria arenilitoris]|uniref:hypothetical protein n=1 Tax=Ruegeria arenilitoris TaxID=1173585 RepID=UPI001479E58D|nr:hypothetical protein [Ruegeria arenilitoris]
MYQFVSECIRLFLRERVTQHGTAFLAGDGRFAISAVSSGQEKERLASLLPIIRQEQNEFDFKVSIGPTKSASNEKKLPVFFRKTKIGELDQGVSDAIRREMKILGFSGCFGSAEAKVKLKHGTDGELFDTIALDITRPIWVDRWEIWEP